MDAKTISNDVKTEVQKQLEKLDTLRDEVKLHFHLATLDAKQEWNDKLEPRINEVQKVAHQASETSRNALHELVSHVEGFVTKLRSPTTKSS